MNRYALAKLVQWAGSNGVDGRKRLQKVIFLLQDAGCPFHAEYGLHHYGPYSRDVAGACDELCASGLLEETAEVTTVGTRYNYRMSQVGSAAIQKTEDQSPAQTRALAGFEVLAKQLLSEDLWELELGATILYFYQKSKNWDDAVKKACECKKVSDDKREALPAAQSLARTVHAHSASAQSAA